MPSSGRSPTFWNSANSAIGTAPSSTARSDSLARMPSEPPGCMVMVTAPSVASFTASAKVWALTVWNSVAPQGIATSHSTWAAAGRAAPAASAPASVSERRNIGSASLLVRAGPLVPAGSAGEGSDLLGLTAVYEEIGAVDVHRAVRGEEGAEGAHVLGQGVAGHAEHLPRALRGVGLDVDPRRLRALDQPFLHALHAHRAGIHRDHAHPARPADLGEALGDVVERGVERAADQEARLRLLRRGADVVDDDAVAGLLQMREGRAARPHVAVELQREALLPLRVRQLEEV